MPGYDPFPQRDLGFVTYSMSRPLIEFLVRRRVERRANVTLRPRCRVRDLVPSDDHAAVIAVRFENPDREGETLSADVVVDASGRGNLTRNLLEAIGQTMPEETVIGVDIGYATAVFAIPDDAPSDWKAMRTLPNIQESTRGALMLPLEGGRWMVTLGGRRDDKPPGDAEGFLTFAQQLRTPTLYNAIRRAKLLDDVVRFGFSGSVWRHFERLESFPRGLLPLGDAICCFNPVYGQGMSVAAQEALLLQRLLRSQEGDPLAGLAPAFFAEASGLIETPWASAAVPDLAFSETEGQRPPDLERTLRFRRALNRLMAADPAVHQKVLEVQHLMKPRSVLLDPALVQRVQAMMGEA